MIWKVEQLEEHTELSDVILTAQAAWEVGKYNWKNV